MDKFYIMLEKTQLEGLLQGYKDVVKKVITDTSKGGNSGILGIKNFTVNINKDGSWEGRIYNNVAKFWNETTSVKLYNALDSYYKTNLVALQNVVDIYAGLESKVGGTDLGGTSEISDEEYVLLKDKIQLTSELKVNFILVNINTFNSFVHGASRTSIPNKINEINAYLEENFKNRSTTLDLFIEKAKQSNDLFRAQLQEILQEYSDVIEKNIKILTTMEETSIKDVNEKI